jgi:hypothetical protein
MVLVGGKNMAQPVRLYAADGVPLTQTGGKLDVNATVTVTGGDASAANQLTQITAEQDILAKLIAAPATEAKQDTIISLMGGSSGTVYKGKYRTTTTGATEAITIPADSDRAIFFPTENSDAYIEINAAATTTSPIYISELTNLELNLGGVTTLNIYVVSGNVGVIFYG